jgi:RNA polymerase sigma factor (sigma-70 family)
MGRFSGFGSSYSITGSLPSHGGFKDRQGNLTGMGLIDSIPDRFETEHPAAPTTADHRGAVHQLFHDHNRALVKFLLTRLSSEEALDVAQEAYVRLLQLNEPGAIGFLRGYLFRIAANLSVDRVRRRVVRDKVAVALFEDLPALAGEDQRAITREEFEIACEAIEELPRGARDAFSLRIIEGYSVREVADEMGVDERTVRKHVSRALLHCRRRLQNRDSRGTR